jgi:hypothetical protein
VDVTIIEDTTNFLIIIIMFRNLQEVLYILKLRSNDG